MTRTNPTFSFAALAILGLVSGCEIQLNFGKPLTGSGVSLTEIRDTDRFTKIEVSGALTVKAKIGESQSVQISGDDNIVPLVTTSVHKGTLKIQVQHNGSLKPKVPLTATIVAEDLVAANISGACEVEVSGVVADDFNVDLSGASQLTLSGECQQLTADISGASRFDGSSMQAQNVKIDVSGAGNAKVYASESISGDASGASNLRYAGNPDRAHIDSSGASTVKAE